LAVNPFSAKALGHMAPSSRFALSLKPSVTYLVLNFCATWKKRTTLPSLAKIRGNPAFHEGRGAGKSTTQGVEKRMLILKEILERKFAQQKA